MGAAPFASSVDQGNAIAQSSLGFCYAKGKGVPQDELESARFYRLAADQNNADAHNTLGTFYAEGEGVPRDEHEAARLYRCAADQGNADAQNSLGALYAAGKGVPQDKRETARLFRLAADKGDAYAQYNIGCSYVNGHGVPQDGREAGRLFHLAAKQDNAQALYTLGKALIEGCETFLALPRQPSKGALYLARAAQQVESFEVQQMALACLDEHAHEREVVHACCIDCGKSKGLKVCGKCKVAKWCGPECAKRMWPAHKACCKLWAGAQGATGAEPAPVTEAAEDVAHEQASLWGCSSRTVLFGILGGVGVVTLSALCTMMPKQICRPAQGSHSAHACRE